MKNTSTLYKLLNLGYAISCGGLVTAIALSAPEAKAFSLGGLVNSVIVQGVNEAAGVRVLDDNTEIFSTSPSRTTVTNNGGYTGAINNPDKYVAPDHTNSMAQDCVEVGGEWVNNTCKF